VTPSVTAPSDTNLSDATGSLVCELRCRHLYPLIKFKDDYNHFAMARTMHSSGRVLYSQKREW